MHALLSALVREGNRMSANSARHSGDVRKMWNVPLGSTGRERGSGFVEGCRLKISVTARQIARRFGFGNSYISWHRAARHEPCRWLTGNH
jgi:hypothetical protein